MVWARFSMQTKPLLVRVNNGSTARKYQDDILRPVLVP